MIKTLVVSSLFAFSVLTQTAFGGPDRLLTPVHSSPTAMWRCGADLELIKSDRGLVHEYTFDGSEVLIAMQYCVEGKHPLTDDRNSYRVPAGTKGWVSKDGNRVVLKECVNQAICLGCKPPQVEVVRLAPPPPAPPKIRRPNPAPAPPPPPTKPAHTCTVCEGFESIDSEGYGVELDSVYAGKGFPEFTVKGRFKGDVRNFKWDINGDVEVLGEVLSIDPENLEPGAYTIRLTAEDTDGHTVTCSFVMTVVAPPKPPKGKSWIKRHKKALIITALIVCGATAAISYGTSTMVPPCGYFGPGALIKPFGIPGGAGFVP